jgi:YD repeat-containing protein
MKIHMGADHAGYLLKEELKKYITELGHETVDHGAFTLDVQDDYLYNISAWIVDKPQRYRFFDFDNVTKLRERTYRYDNLSYGSVPTRGDLTWEEHWLSNASANSTIKYTYENYGNLIERTDPNGNKSAYIYGVRDITHTYADRFVNAKNYSINYNYDLGTGNLLSETDANGYLTNYSYDLFGRIIKEIKPYDSAIYATKEYNYSFDGIAPELIKVSQRELTGTNNTFDSLYFYDGFGNLIQIKTEVNATARLEKDFFYDSERRLVREFNPYFVNSSESYSNPNNDLTADSLYYYDPLSRATYALYAGGGTERVVFDHSRVTTYDKNGNKKVYYVDAYGRVVRVIEYVDNNYYTTFYKYAPTGEIVQINDSLGNVYTYQYDSLGRKTKEINPDLGTWNYQYDAVGNLINQIDNRSINISLKYDNLNRLISKTSSGQSISYIYDRINGTLWKTITLDTTSEEGYDQRLRKINETMTIDGRNFTKKWTYDSLDRVVNETLPDNSLILYTYTSHGDLKTVGSIIDSVLYNEFSKPTQFLYHNGLQTNISYDSSTSRVKQIKTSTYQNINYHYDLVGNILLINDTANNFAKLAIYDTIDRLSYSHVIQNQTSTIFNYTYDALGDILLTSGRVNVTYYYGLGPLHAPKKIAIFATLPSISFVFPTPSNGSTQSGDSISVNISSIHDTSHYVLFDFNKDLRLWMRMDDLNNSGDLVDLSSYGNNGTRSGGALISSLGKFGNSITFNSISDSVRIPDSPSLDINQSITVSFWFKGTNATYNQNFVSKYDGISSNQITWQATLASGGICNGIGFYVSESGNASDRVYIRNCNQTYQDGLWHHFVGIFDAGKNISLYIDGNTTNSTLVGAVANVTAIYTNNQNIYVGSRNNDTYQGSIDDLAIFARALSSSEVLSLYGTNVGYYNDFVNLASKNYTLQGYTVDTYGLKNQTEERKVALSNVLNLTSLAYVYKNTTRYVFRFVVNNTGVSTLSNISWVFNTGQNIESSQYNTTLTGGEDLFVYVYHNYTSSGNYTVIASAQSGEIFTSKSLVVNV